MLSEAAAMSLPKKRRLSNEDDEVNGYERSESSGDSGAASRKILVGGAVPANESNVPVPKRKLDLTNLIEKELASVANVGGSVSSVEDAQRHRKTSLTMRLLQEGKSFKHSNYKHRRYFNCG